MIHPPPPTRPGPHTPLQMMIMILIVIVMNVAVQWSQMIRIRKTMSFIYLFISQNVPFSLISYFFIG